VITRNEKPMTISIIATVLNEGESIRRLMDSLCAQTCRPDEVVIVDGGSRDNTVAVLREYEGRLPLRVLVEPGANISAGRNRAIAAAQGDIIAVTDAGVTLERDWLEHLTQPLLDDPALQVVGGFFRADPYTIFEVALGATTLPLEDEIKAETFLPSSRSVAFRKRAWEAVSGYPEWLDFCEDLIFDLRLKAVMPPFAFAPQAVAWFRPRQSLRSFYKQYTLYARGDGKADLWRKRHAIRYATYGIAFPMLVWLGWRVHPLFFGLLLLGGAAYLRAPYRRLTPVLREASKTNRIRVTLVSNLHAIMLVPVIRVVGDVAKMIGYPVGWWWRLKHRPPRWR
jgi:glycosyltransferase involved in cell wall biosynthesis